MNTFKIIDQCDFTPDISIAMLAYNHEKFIVEAIESVLMQNTSYTYKVIIAEDCSTDRTREILLEYQRKYPDKFKLILQNENVGASINNTNLLTNLEGKYIAALEGDDYWTDPNKLQKQVDFLENNQEYVLCCTSYNILRGNEISVPNYLYDCDKDIETIDLLSNNNIGTLTVVCKTECLKKTLSNGILLDLGFWLNLSKIGKIKYLSEKTGVYRILDNSATGRNNLSAQINYYKNIYKTREPFILEIKDKKIKRTLLINSFTPYSNSVRLSGKLLWIKIWIGFFINNGISISSLKIFLRQIHPIN
jgi:glycosyltransferase involved in cell wall biosynthesis